MTDSGTGIARRGRAADLREFYKADQARHGGGTGLGLALVKHTVEGHGGTVGVKSERGKGSVFTFAIPVSVSEELPLSLRIQQVISQLWPIESF